MASQKQIDTWTKQAQIINSNPDYVSLYVKYKQEAKAADQRLVRLEALQWEEHFHGVLEFSYKRALKDVKSWGGDQRFNTAPYIYDVKLQKTRALTKTELEAKLSDIERFLHAPTSKKSSILKIYQKRTDTINKKYADEFGVEFTWQELANYYESDEAEKRDSAKGSKTLVRALAVIKGITSDTLKDIKDVNERIERVSSDKVVNQMAKDLLENGYTYDKLLGGSKK